jgi:TPR repeat protein
MPDIDTHRSLLAMHDRAYLALLDFAKQNGFGVPENGRELYVWLLSEAKRGHSQAQLFVAKLLFLGLFADRDHDQAREWCQKAADQKNPLAITMLGGFYQSGSGGLTEDPSKAVELWQLSSELHETGAMRALAGMYLDGRFLRKDRSMGLELLRNAARNGDELAQCELGMLLIDAEDPALEAEGLRWFRAAAEGNLSTAHRHLARYYRYGEHGLGVDHATAHLHSEAAKKLEAVFL